jgi:signal peptidase I
MESNSGAADKAAKVKNKKRGDAIFIAVCVICVLLLRVFVFQFVNISGESMKPTLENGQMIFVEKVSYWLNPPKRGDVVVFRNPQGMELVKRIIGLPGEEIEIKNGVVFIGGAGLEAKFQFYMSEAESMDTYTISENSYFLMGDNRDNSGDSRVFGEIDRKDFIGRMLFVLF